MVTEAKQTRFNIEVIRESLTSLAASSARQLELNKVGLKHLEDVFDPMPLDYLSWLKRQEIVNESFVSEFNNIHEQIEEHIGHLEHTELDEFIASNNPALQKWREASIKLLRVLNDV